jgi:hypothetical protein
MIRPENVQTKMIRLPWSLKKPAPVNQQSNFENDISETAAGAVLKPARQFLIKKRCSL